MTDSADPDRHLPGPRLLGAGARRLTSLLRRRPGREEEPQPAVAPPMAAPAAARAGPRILFVQPGGTDERLAHLAAAAAAAGAQVELLTPEALAGESVELAAAEWVVIPCMPWDATLERLLAVVRQHGVPLCCDLGDTLTARGMPLEPALVAADLCIAATREVAAHARAAQKPVFLLPDGFDEATMAAARLALRARRTAPPETVVRIGCPGFGGIGGPAFRTVLAEVVRVLAERPECRLVLPRPAAPAEALDIWGYPGLPGRLDQIEWRDALTPAQQFEELARLDILLVPVEMGDRAREAGSERGFVAAALAGVCAIASPSGPLLRAIRDGETGLLARSGAEWFAALCRLVEDPARRGALARSAWLDVLYPYGPQRRAEAWWLMLRQLEGGRAAAGAFATELLRAGQPSVPPARQPAAVVFAADQLGQAEVTVVIPLYNYQDYVEAALDSVAAQTLAVLDLVVVDDCSTDGSLDVVMAWVGRHAGRFNRLVVLRHAANAGQGLARNLGFETAETPFVLPLDADNLLRAECCEACLAALGKPGGGGAAFAYPRIQCFGETQGVIGAAPFLAARLVGGNYIDTMALVAKWAWAAAGGYRAQRRGWEDYEFWCRLVERGFWGVPVAAVLGEYRVHGASMSRLTTDERHNKRLLVDEMQQLHPWLSITVPDDEEGASS